MKKIFETPHLCVDMFMTENIITASGTASEAKSAQAVAAEQLNANGINEANTYKTVKVTL